MRHPNSPDPSADPLDPALPLVSLAAPWRLEYIESLGDAPADAPSPTPTKTAKPAATGSFLRDYWLSPSSDEANRVVLRLRCVDTSAPADAAPSDRLAGMILLNAFPYANGHLLVALADPRPTLLDYDADQRAALWRLTDIAAELMQTALEPQGINIGVNQGRAAGAGVPSHLHVHLVPRWSGDVNFMSVTARVRVIPSSLDAMYARYRTALARFKSAPAS